MDLEISSRAFLKGRTDLNDQVSFKQTEKKNTATFSVAKEKGAKVQGERHLDVTAK